MAQAAAENKRSAQGIRSVETGFRVLDALCEAGEPVTLSALARTAAMTPSKARHYLVSLLNVGLAEQSPGDGRYTLGPYALKLGLEAIRRFDIMSVADRAATRLIAQTNASVLLSIWGSNGPTVVARHDSPVFRTLDFRLGMHPPLTWGATGRVFLACAPREVVTPLLERELAAARAGDTPLPLTRKDVAAIIERVSTAGIEIMEPVRLSTGSALEGYAAAAAPIFNSSGEVSVVLTATFPTKEGPCPIDDVRAHVLNVTRQASAEAGYNAAP